MHANVQLEVDGRPTDPEPPPDRIQDGLLLLAFQRAAVIAFHRGKPVTVKLNGRPYRVVHVDPLR